MSDAHSWRASRWRRLQAALIPFLVSPLIAALARTWRYTLDGADVYDRILAEGRRPIIAFWHGRILAGLPHFRNRGIVVITSENFDGEWIAGIIARFGYGAARGSSSRGAVRALVQMKRLMREGHPTAFTLDGPRGPACRAQPGAVWLAKATGQPILPFHVVASRGWVLRSWDRTLIPKPWARLGLAIGPPFEVDACLDDDGLERRRRDLEAELARLEVRARALVSAESL